MSARILVADDEDSLRWVLEKGLHQAGYEVTAVKDGAAAVRAVEAEPFDLVLLDVRMPGMDGLTALGKMRELRPTASIVVMTAHGTMETAIQAMQRGAYDYLTKPFDLDEVLLLAQRALEAGRLTQEVTRLKTGMQEVREFSALYGAFREGRESPLPPLQIQQHISDALAGPVVGELPAAAGREQGETRIEQVRLFARRSRRVKRGVFQQPDHLASPAICDRGRPRLHCGDGIEVVDGLLGNAPFDCCA